MIRTLYQSAFYPTELYALFKVKMEASKFAPSTEELDVLAPGADDREFCYEALKRVSRSFSVVIQQLPEELRDPVAIFYLVLRALDTVEDDMSIPNKEKLPMLVSFHERAHTDDFRLEGVGDHKDYQTLLEHYPKVTAVLNSLDQGYVDVIRDICRRMGEGMAEFADREVDTLEDWDLYCHYVAGLVGIGLSKLFAESGHEDASFANFDDVSNSMGLFLQKTNIIRDYREDLDADRIFWPKAVWSKHAPSIGAFAKAPTAKQSMDCLDELVANALTHLPDCMEYMYRLRQPEVFRFCAIPQVMAIATLDKVHHNPDVFLRNVKIRKGLAAKLMVEVNDFNDVLNVFNLFLKRMRNRCEPGSPLLEPISDGFAAIMAYRNKI